MRRWLSRPFLCKFGFHRFDSEPRVFHICERCGAECIYVLEP